MGGSNSDQLIEYVHSYDPRSWSCLHLAEGAFACNNATVQHNDIGPCGTDTFQEWADGISVSCQNSWIHNNTINNPTVSHTKSIPSDVADDEDRMVASCSSVPLGLWWKTIPSSLKKYVILARSQPRPPRLTVW